MKIAGSGLSRKARWIVTVMMACSVIGLLLNTIYVPETSSRVTAEMIQQSVIRQRVICMGIIFLAVLGYPALAARLRRKANS